MAYLIEDLRKKAEDYGSSERAMLKQAILEYDNIVIRRNATMTNLQETSATYAVESVLSRFAEDAVNSTYGLVWNAVGAPFTITDRTNTETDLTPLSEKLTADLENSESHFKEAFRYVLKNYLEYGSAWVYVLKRPTGGIMHRVFSVKEIARSLDIFKDLECLFLDRGGKAYTLVEALNPGFRIYQKNEADNDISGTEVSDLNPIVEISQSGIYSDCYPVGYGIKALSDLKRYDNIVKSLTEAAGLGLKPVPYMSSGVNMANKSLLSFFPQKNEDDPIIIDAAIADKIIPFGYVPYAAASADAWRLFELAAINIRESFGFINRLLTIKDDAQMTATEAQIRSQADFSQIRDTIESIFTFLNRLHRVQLSLLLKTEEYSEWKDLKPENLEFFHTSIFKKQAETEKLNEINAGVDLSMKVAQFAAAMNQTGLGDIVDPRKLIENIAKSTKLTLARQERSVALTSLFRSLTDSQDAQME